MRPAVRRGRAGRGASDSSDAVRAYSRAPLPRRRTPWRDAAFCVVDLETTGLDPRADAIVAWATVPVDGGRVIAGTACEGLVRPPGSVPAAAVRIHGLRDADLASAPPLEEAIDVLLGAITGRVLVAHAAWIERGFLARALRARGTRLRGPIVDTHGLGRLWLGERDGRTPWPLPLGTLAAELGLPVHRPHSAAGDALTTAQAFIALCSHLDAFAGETVRTLARAEQRVQAGKLYARFR
jgi:DNA polymerase-3 subunit epsilon